MKTVKAKLIIDKGKCNLVYKKQVIFTCDNIMIPHLCYALTNNAYAFYRLAKNYVCYNTKLEQDGDLPERLQIQTYENLIDNVKQNFISAQAVNLPDKFEQGSQFDNIIQICYTELNMYDYNGDEFAINDMFHNISNDEINNIQLNLIHLFCLIENTLNKNN